MHRFCSWGEPMMDTYTLACWRSPDISARVTVTPLTRGSRSSKRMVSLATSRTTSATRARRCVFIALFSVRDRPPSQQASGRHCSPTLRLLGRLNIHLVIDELCHGSSTQSLHDLAGRRADRSEERRVGKE